jgi:YaiO family outer membrane protein
MLRLQLVLLSVVGGLCLAQPHLAWAATFSETYEQGVRLKVAGDYPAAERALKEALALQPDNADTLLQLGLVQAYQEKYDGALASLARAHALAPDYHDVTIAIARIRSWQGRDADAIAELDRVLAHAPDHAEALGLKRELTERANTSKPHRWRLDADFAHSVLGRSANKPWNEGGVIIQYGLTPSTDIRAGAVESHRYGMEDTQARVGLSHRFAPWFNAGLDLGVTPSADFLPQWDIRMEAAGRVSEGEGWLGATWLTGELRQRDYMSGAVQSFNPGLEQNFLGDRITLTGRWLLSRDDKEDKHLTGWLGRLDVRPIEHVRLFAGRADAPETDLGRTINVESTFGGVAFDVTDSTTLGLGFTREERKNSFTRNEIATSITVRF